MSSAPVASPTPIICVTIGGNTSVSLSGAEIVSPRSMLLRVAMIASSMMALPGGLGGDLEAVENRHARADQRRQRAAEPRHGDLAHDVAEHRHLQHRSRRSTRRPFVGRVVALERRSRRRRRRRAGTGSSDTRLLLSAMTMRVGSGRSAPRPGEQRRERRDDLPQNDADDDAGDDDDGDRIDHRRLHLARPA